MSLKLYVGLFLAALAALAVPVNAQTVIYSAASPTAAPGDVLISNMTGTDSSGQNLNEGFNVATQIAGYRPVQGQFFTTGTNLLGYTLNSVSLQQVTYAGTNFTTINPGSFTLRVTKPTGSLAAGPSSQTVLHTEVAAVTGTEANNFGQGFTGTGTGRYITFSFATPVQLLANTVYGFDVGSTTESFETNGSRFNPYADGVAYNSGDNGISGPGSDYILTGDRVFAADLTPSAAPEPSQLAGLGLTGISVLGLLWKARRRAAPKNLIS